MPFHGNKMPIIITHISALFMEIYLKMYAKF
jgi:hypothetical protein